jgi:hypothetical protein
MEGEEVYEGDDHSMGDGGLILGLSWIAGRGVEFGSWIGSVQAPVCWRFWAWGPGYPYDILELGSCPSWQGGTRFWAVFTQFSSGQQEKWKAEG